MLLTIYPVSKDLWFFWLGFLVVWLVFLVYVILTLLHTSFSSTIIHTMNSGVEFSEKYLALNNTATDTPPNSMA